MFEMNFFFFSLGEVIPRSFGEQINFDDDSDPIVRRLKFYRESPSYWYSGLYDAAREMNHSRSDILSRFAIADNPNSPNHPHEQWLRIIRYDKNTYEILEQPPATEVQRIRSESSDSLRRLLDESESTPPGGNVIPFPTAGVSSRSQTEAPN